LPTLTSNSSELTWRPARVGLSFRFGLFALWTSRLDALLPCEHFTEWPDDPSLTNFPYIELENGIDAIVMRSHPVSRPLPAFSLKGDAFWYSTKSYCHYWTDLRGSFDGYLAHFSSKSRTTLRRKVRRLFAQWPNQVHFQTYRTPEEMGAFLKLARQVSRQTYQERLLNAGIPETPEFLNKLQKLAGSDSVRGFILSVGAEPIAYLCTPARNGVLNYDYLGYAPEYANWSVGTVLQYLAFESLFAEWRFTCFDFTEGDAPQKQLFSTHSKTCSDLYVFPCRPSMFLLAFAHYALGRVVAGCLRLAGFLKLREGIRKWLHR